MPLHNISAYVLPSGKVKIMKQYLQNTPVCSKIYNCIRTHTLVHTDLLKFIFLVQKILQIVNRYKTLFKGSNVCSFCKDENYPSHFYKSCYTECLLSR